MHTPAVSVGSSLDGPRLDHTSSVWVAVCSLLTFGLYLPIWYMNRLARLNKLRTTRKINSTLVIVLLCLSGLNASGVLSFAGGGDIGSVLTLSSLGNMLSLAAGMILLSLRSRVREMIREHYGEKLSWFATMTVGEIYLQAKMNRLPACDVSAEADRELLQDEAVSYIPVSGA